MVKEYNNNNLHFRVSISASSVMLTARTSRNPAQYQLIGTKERIAEISIQPNRFSHNVPKGCLFCQMPGFPRIGDFDRVIRQLPAEVINEWNKLGFAQLTTSAAL